MLLSTIFTTFALSLAVVSAPVTEDIEARANSVNCKKVGGGYLSGHVGSKSSFPLQRLIYAHLPGSADKLKAFSKASNSQLVFTPSSYKSALKVEFQTCAGFGETPGETFPGSNEYSGRIYIPSLKKCVHITNQGAAKGPYYPVVTSCKGVGNGLIPYADTFLFRGNEGNAIYFVSGSTTCLQTPLSITIHRPERPTKRVLTHRVDVGCLGMSLLRSIPPFTDMSDSYKSKNGTPITSKSKQLILTCVNDGGSSPFYLAPKAV